MRNKKLENMLDRITIDPKVCRGQPCIRGMSMPVYSLLFDLLNSEASSDIEGSIIIIEEARVRIRKLPIQQ